jgi:hypothetical protein
LTHIRTISSASLKKMTIGDVRTILSKSTVGVDRVDELRRAVAWLIIRDVQASPQVLIDIAQLQSSWGTAKVSATAERFWKLKSFCRMSQHLKKQAWLELSVEILRERRTCSTKEV